MYPAALARVLSIQPVLDAVDRDRTLARGQSLDTLEVGQKVSGRIQSQADGISVVVIEGQAVAMRLPPQAAVGDTLKLSFAGRMPQPVFMLEADEAAAGESTQLSHTARMLSDIMQRVPERGLPTLQPTAPLLAQPSADPAALALALRTALVRSGLFYESHLADWATGSDTLEGLLQEPQNRLSPPGMLAEAARAAATPERAAGSDSLSLLASGELAGQKTANPLHALLTQQLQVLESPQFAWKGEIWPGQPIEWQVRQEDERSTDRNPLSTGADDARNWESRLRLTLPNLGALDIHIRLDAAQNFSIRVVPGDAATESLLQANQPRLLGLLAEAGCMVQTLTVKQDDGA